jgi:hypothetical protein
MPCNHKSLTFHDARIHHVTLQPGGVVEVRFSHVEVYTLSGPGRFSVTAHAGLLRCERVEDLRMVGLLNDEGWVVDALLPGDAEWSEDVQLAADEYKKNLNAGTINLKLNNGASLIIEAKQISISLVDNGRFQEYFFEAGRSDSERGEDPDRGDRE